MFKKERWAKVMVFAGIVLMTGCASRYPIPVNEPQALMENEKGEMVRVKPDYTRGGLLPPESMLEAIENMKIYGDAYQDYSDTLRRGEYITDDLALLGAVTGVIGGLTSSIETVVAGAVLGAGAPMVSQRYNFLIQANNYEKSSTAMYCMYTRLRPTKGAGIELLDAQEWIDDIRRRLRKAQASVELVDVVLTDLTATIKASLKADEEAKKAKEKKQITEAEEVATKDEANAATAKSNAAINALEKDAAIAATATATAKSNAATIAARKAREEKRLADLHVLTSGIKECVAAFGSS